MVFWEGVLGVWGIGKLGDSANVDLIFSNSRLTRTAQGGQLEKGSLRRAAWGGQLEEGS